MNTSSRIKKRTFMIKIIFTAFILFCLANVKGQEVMICHLHSFNQTAKPNVKPYYVNAENPAFLCDSTSDDDRPGWDLWIGYYFNDTINHPIYSCGHKGSYSLRRKKDGSEAHYCDICNKKIKIYYYPKEAILTDEVND